MLKTKITLDRDDVIGEIDKRITGQFVEQVKDCVYGGLYQPGHPLSDEQGFRKDVIEEIKNLKIPGVRVPGGNYVSGYHWRDGIGPKSERPVRIERAWGAIDTNEMGTHEYIEWAEKCNMETWLTANLGTGTPEEAADWVEYCNIKGGTYLSDLRRKNGREKPFDVKFWFLGNEMDGPWEIGYQEPADFGKKARETARLMKLTDKDIELAVAGTSWRHLSTHIDWDNTVLSYTYDYVDYLSVHEYFEWDESYGLKEYLASYKRLDKFINEMILACDYVKAKKNSKKTMMLTLDEWAVRFPQRKGYETDLTLRPMGIVDLLAGASAWLAFINHADRLKMGCETMLVNRAAPIVTTDKGIVRQSIYYTLYQMTHYAKGTALRVGLTSPKYDSVTAEDAVTTPACACYNGENGEVTVFVMNIGDSPAEISLNLYNFGKTSLIEHSVMTNTDLYAFNTEENPDVLKPVAYEGSIAAYAKDKTVVIPAYSWNMLRFKCE